VCRLQLLLALASAVIFRSESRETDHILLSQIRDSSNLEGQVPVFISPRNRVAQLYSQALSSLFVFQIIYEQETHYVTATETKRLMLFKETAAVYCESHTEHTNTFCGQTAEFWHVKADGTYSNR
jgi:hypothetical protein